MNKKSLGFEIVFNFYTTNYGGGKELISSVKCDAKGRDGSNGEFEFFKTAEEASEFLENYNTSEFLKHSVEIKESIILY